MSLSGNSRPKQKLYLVGGLEHLKKIHILGIIIPTSYGWCPFSAWKSQISTRKLGRRSRADLGASWLPEVPIGARRAAVFGDRRASCEESFDDKFYMKTMIIEYDNHDNDIYIIIPKWFPAVITRPFLPIWFRLTMKLFPWRRWSMMEEVPEIERERDMKSWTLLLRSVTSVRFWGAVVDLKLPGNSLTSELARQHPKHCCNVACWL